MDYASFFPGLNPVSLIDILLWRAERTPHILAITQLKEGGAERALTYAQLATAVCQVGAQVQAERVAGQPVLLVYPPGLDFLIAFLGAIAGGAIPTPTYPPDPRRLNRTLPRFQAIVADSGAPIVLSTTPMSGMAGELSQAAPDLKSLRWVATDALPPGLEDTWRRPDYRPEQLCLLQYTSGSTGTPKGVMVSHHCLLLNIAWLTHAVWEAWAWGAAVTWLPNYHDMGLIDGLLRPLYAGQPCTFMSPIMFLKRPMLWLETITRVKATISGAPNFAYDLCARQARPEDLEHLDLSSWATAYNGAEPVRVDTLERFNKVFGPVGFRPRAHTPSYGLAEAGLYVCCTGHGVGARILQVSATDLAENRATLLTPLHAQEEELASEAMPEVGASEATPAMNASSPSDAMTLVSVGRSHLPIRIVDPQTFEPLPPRQVGELWVTGTSVAQGYWRNEAATSETYRAYTRTDEGPFLRTGDLAFLTEDRDLFITGRLKDLIIIRGRNHYPQDIELTAERACPEALRPGCGAAFAVDVAGEERLVLAFELERRYNDGFSVQPDRRRPDAEIDAFNAPLKGPADPAELVHRLTVAIAERHEVQLQGVIFLRAGSIPKTSSGKIQRRGCRSAWLSSGLDILHEWRDPSLERGLMGRAQEDAVALEGGLEVADLSAPPESDANPSVAVEAVAAKSMAPASVTAASSTGLQSSVIQKESVAAEPVSSETHGASAAGTSPSASAAGLPPLKTFLQAEVAAALGLEPRKLAWDRPFATYGLDSARAVSLVGRLEQALSLSLPATLLYDYPTLSQLEAHLRSLSSPAQDAAPPALPPLSAQRESAEPIAIVGIGCRLPGASGPEGFWKLLAEGIDATGEVPPDRWRLEDYYDPELKSPGKIISRRGGFLKQIDTFDPHFFNLSPREAACMDPQQRLLLEVTWEALEDAGLPPASLAGSKTGVFIGICNSDYHQQLFSSRDDIEPYYATGTAFSIAANRLSYLLDLSGPSLAIDSACSSSLVAIHMALQSLRAGESTLAIAGGVNLILAPDVSINFSKAGVMARDGRCKTFDASADGYARGEGAGVIILKPLSRAKADGDPIYALLLGSAVNSDGRTNGIMAPSGPAQVKVITQAWQQAGVSPGKAQYVECHGTGTILGDPIEVTSLASVIQQDRPQGQLCAIGSAKSNIGHLESGAGVAGLIKAALSLKHGKIPPSLHYRRPNPHIPFESLPVKVQTRLEDWPRTGEPALAGVSSFGFGGTNAHAVLMEAPKTDEKQVIMPADASRLRLLTVSAHQESALLERLKQLHTHLAQPTPPGWADLCYTSGQRRQHHTHRLALVARQTSEARELLEAAVRGELPAGVARGQALPADERQVVFLAPGQGSQWYGMGRGLLQAEPVFRAMMERCDTFIFKTFGWSLLEALAADEHASQVHQTWLTQPALFSLQVSLAALWRSWGIAPAAVVGHSMGEVAAAHICGALELEDALRVIVLRGQVMQRLAGQGAMAAVELPLEEARGWLKGFEQVLSVAANNGPRSSTLAGSPEALAELLPRLEQAGIFCRKLRVDLAGHSPQMDGLMAPLLEAIGPLPLHDPTVPVYSTVTGGPALPDAFSTAYWARNLREPVLFYAALRSILETGHTVFVELSPHPILLPAVQQLLVHTGRSGLTLPSLRREADEHQVALTSLSSLYAAGCEVNFARVNPGPAQVISLPTYPWQRERCWVEPKTAPETTPPLDGSRHPLLGAPVELALQPGTHAWNLVLETRGLPFLKDHQVQDMVVYPATGYLELVRAGLQDAFGDLSHMVTEARFEKALFLTPGLPRQVQLVIEEAGDGSRFQVLSRPMGKARGAWTRHCQGQVALHLAEPGTVTPLSTLQKWLSRGVSAREHYRRCDARGIQYGPAFQGVRALWEGEGEALGEVVLPETVPGEGWLFHPALLDACLQVMAAVLPAEGSDATDSYLPVSLARLSVYGPVEGTVWSHVVLSERARGQRDTYTAQVTLYHADGRLLAEAQGFTIQRLGKDLAEEGEVARWFHQVRFDPVPRGAGLASGTAEGSGERSPRASAGKGVWLVFADETGLGARVLEEAGRRGQACLRVTRGAALAEVPGEGYQANPLSPQDFQRLVAEVSAGPGLAGALYLWGLDGPASEALERAGDAGTVAEQLTLTQTLLTGALHLAQAMQGVGREAGNEGGALGARLWLVTRGAQAVAPAKQVASAQVPWWGLARGLAQELGPTWGGVLDLEPGGDEGDAARQVLVEALEPQEEDQLVFRQGHRYAARLATLGVPPAGSGLSLRTEGTYLITGGLGAIGLKLAAWLVDKGARHLVLTSRRGYAPPDQWEVLASKGEREAVGLKALRDRGVIIQVAAVDVTDEQAMGSLISSLKPGLRGVIHAAGVVSPLAVEAVTAAELATNLAPKLQGGWVLHRLTRGRRLDFFILFSSAAATWGSRWLSHYAAANSALDGLAAWRQAQRLPVTCVNWAMWGEGGMANEAENEQLLLRMGLTPMAPEKALAALERLVMAEVPQATVAAVDWSVFKPLYEQQGRRKLLAGMDREKETEKSVAAAGGESAVLEQLRVAEVSARKGLLEKYLVQEAARVLAIPLERVNKRAALTAQGLDSLMASELRNRLQKGLGVKLNVVSFLRGDDLVKLADQLGQALEPVLQAGAGGGAAESPERGLGRSEGERQLEDARLEGLELEGGRPYTGGQAAQILLTGATGFLGAFVLAELCRSTTAQVHCLVRAADDAEAMHRLQQTLEGYLLWDEALRSRIVPVAGDLGAPRLGLSDARWAGLAEEIDQILHVGFLVNFLFSYEDMRATNVLGTRALLSLAAQKRVKPLHHVSSFSVFLTPENTGKEVLESDVPHHGPGGYRETKRVCEALLRAARGRGLPISLYRPPFISWDSQTGAYNEKDFLIRLLVGCLELGVAPVLSPVFHLAAVDYVAKALVTLAGEPTALGRDYHLLGEEVGMPWEQLVRVLEAAGAPLEVASYGAWREVLRQSGEGNPLQPFFPAHVDAGEKGVAVLEIFDRDFVPARVSMANTRAALAERVTCPAVDEELVRAFLKRVKALRPDLAARWARKARAA